MQIEGEDLEVLQEANEEIQNQNASLNEHVPQQ